MKKIVSETIDGSIKDIIQLKTLDNSLEFSQMYDALEDTPRSFQLKLVDALNSLGETMGVPPEEAFNKVLCKSDDENEDVKKKLYNWWRAFFEVLGKCDRIPAERVQEFDQKIDDLMAEIMRAGDAEATSEEEPVLESEEDAEPGYEQATKDDEDKMLANMEFAIQHIGEVANKVKAVVNFINPYCGTEVNESGDQPKFKVGDVVRVMNVSGMDFYGRDAPIGPIVKIEPPHPDVGVYEYLIKGRSGEFFAYEDELELVPERFTEENDVMNKPARYGIGNHVLYKGEECVVTDVDEDLRNDEEIYQVSRDSDKVDGLSFNDWATWDELEPVEGFTEEENSKMKKIAKERGGSEIEPDYDNLPPDWGSWNNYDDDENDEGWDMDSADYEMSDDERKEAWRERHPYLERGGDEWVSMNDYIGEEFGEASDESLEKLKMGRDLGKTFEVGDHVKVTKPGDSKGWKGVVVKINRKSAWPYVVEFPKSWQSTGEYGANEIWFDDSWEGEEFLESGPGEEFWKDMDRVDDLEKKGYWSGVFKVGDKVIWIDPEYPDDPSDGWTVVDAPEDDGVEDPDAIYVIVNDETGSEAEVYGHELRPSGLLKEDGD